MAASSMNEFEFDMIENGLAYGARTRTRFLSMTIGDDPLPYAFQQPELPRLW